jgi:hypothetical protein
MTRILDWLFAITDRFPRWSQPALLGAFILGGIVSLRLLFVLPALFTDPPIVREALVVVMIGAAGGAAAGLVYSLIGRPLLKVTAVGPYLTGIVTVAGYMGALALLVPYVDPEAPRFFGSCLGLFSYLFCVLLFGMVMGRSWFTGPGSLAEDMSIRPPWKQSPAEYRRARMEQRRTARDTEARR